MHIQTSVVNPEGIDVQIVGGTDYGPYVRIRWQNDEAEVKVLTKDINQAVDFANQILTTVQAYNETLNTRESETPVTS